MEYAPVGPQSRVQRVTLWVHAPDRLSGGQRGHGTECHRLAAREVPVFRRVGKPKKVHFSKISSEDAGPEGWASGYEALARPEILTA